MASILVRVRELAVTVALAMCLLPGCAGRSAPEGFASGDIGFVLVNQLGLHALDQQGRLLGRFVTTPAGTLPAMPSLTSDGREVIFSLTRPGTAGAPSGSDIWAAAFDGSVRVLLKHEREGVFYSSPLLDPSGAILYVARRAPLHRDGRYVGNEESIERIDLRTGERRRVIEPAVELTLSPDGATLVYVRWVEGNAPVLRRARVNGGEDRPFLSGADTWFHLQSPRFSPDGRWIAFSGAGHARRAAKVRGLAHLGFTSDLFLAPADGTSLRVLASTVDEVVPAWSPDGRSLAYIATGSLHVVAVADGSVRRLEGGERFFRAGELVWVRR